MRILVVVDVPWYDEVVKELRRANEVHYIFKDTGKFRVENRNYHVPRFFGYHLGYLAIAGLITNYLLLTSKFDVCLTDYRSAYLPTILPMFSRFKKLFKTKFVYDIRTIPVDYKSNDAAVIESRFYRQVSFANRYFHGMTVITPEMQNYLSRKCKGLTSNIGIGESGVDSSLFKPLPTNNEMKNKVGFDSENFVCFYHGSLSNARGIIQLVESFRVIKQHDVNIKLLIIGRGECSDRLLRIISDAEMGDTVKVLDWIPKHEMPSYISAADLCVIPLPDIDWWRVSSPLKLMEYIACGKNILMTDIVAHVAAVSEDNQYFWLHETTADSFADGILKCYATYKMNPASYHDRGMYEREKLIDDITWERRSLSLLQYFSNITGS